MNIYYLESWTCPLIWRAKANRCFSPQMFCYFSRTRFLIVFEFKLFPLSLSLNLFSKKILCTPAVIEHSSALQEIKTAEFTIHPTIQVVCTTAIEAQRQFVTSSRGESLLRRSTFAEYLGLQRHSYLISDLCSNTPQWFSSSVHELLINSDRFEIFRGISAIRNKLKDLADCRRCFCHSHLTFDIIEERRTWQPYLVDVDSPPK